MGMVAALLLAAATGSQSAVDAERAFAAMAQTEGQWSAFRAFAAPDAVMFVPEPSNAQQWLAGRKDPAVPVMWWPALSVVSCDGDTAATTGPWVRAGGTLKGYFTTVWQRQADGSWKWLLDHGDVLATPWAVPETPKIRRPDCSGKIPPIVRVNRADSERGKDFDGHLSRDSSLTWEWEAGPDGSRTVTVRVWNGQGYEPVLVDEVAPGQ